MSELKKLGRPKGWKMSVEQRQKMSELMKQRWVEQKLEEKKVVVE